MSPASPPPVPNPYAPYTGCSPRAGMVQPAPSKTSRVGEGRGVEGHWRASAPPRQRRDPGQGVDGDHGEPDGSHADDHRGALQQAAAHGTDEVDSETETRG